MLYSISTMKYTYKVWIYSLNLNYSSSNIESFFTTKNSNRVNNGNGNNKQTSNLISNVSYTYL